MTDDNDLVKRLRNAATKRDGFDAVYLSPEAADRIEELERILSSGPCEIAAHSNSLTEYMFHWEGRALDAEAKLAKALEALEGCMIGGNHLVTWLPENHLPADTDPLAALVRHGAGVSHDIWCCWRSIMQARTTLAELKGDKL